jgi:hypothetical protein
LDRAAAQARLNIVGVLDPPGPPAAGLVLGRREVGLAGGV